MSGCHPNETLQLCIHGQPVKSGCTKCLVHLYKVPAMSGYEESKDGKINYCLTCHDDLEKCKCIWAAIRDLQIKVNNLEESYRGIFHDTSHLGKLVEKLEENQKSETVTIRNYCRFNLDWEKSINNIIGEVGLLNSKKAEANLVANHYLEVYKRFENLEKNDFNRNEYYLSEFEKIKELINLNVPVDHKPHKCPVCDGKGLYQYSEYNLAIDCRSCEGKGVLWG